VFYAVTGLFSPKATDEDRAEWDKSGEDIMDLGDHELAYEQPATT
jgi:NhaC family Na+:H+ antiporter